MPFIEQKAKSEYKTIDGRRTHVITPEVEITLTNLETGQEYLSDQEADNDVANPATPTKKEHVRRDVHIKVAAIDLGATTNEV